MAKLADLYLARGLEGQFNTALSDEDEAAFQAWRARLPRQLQNLADYDLRGAWKANAKAAANGHLPDTWKKPNHPTFSSESMYSTADAQGGDWQRGRKDWVYWASPHNLRYRSAKGLADYFREAEPESTVVLPIDYSLARPR